MALLDAHADIYARDSVDGMTAAHLALVIGHKELGMDLMERMKA